MSLWTFMLFAVTIGLLILPLIPAFLELANPTDVAPLKVVQSYDNNPMHFAQGFRAYVNNHFGINSFGDMSAEKNRGGVLADGSKYEVVGEDGKVVLNASKGSEKILLSPYTIRLPDDGSFDSEAFSKTGIVTGKNCRTRALLCDEDINFGPNNTLLRWAHSEGNINVGDNSILYGRLTAKKTVTLGVGTVFERLHANKIVIGAELAENDMPIVSRTELAELKGVKLQAERRSLLEGNLDFPAYSTFDGDIVAGSTAFIGDYAHIKGSIKSNALNDVYHYLQTSGVLAAEDKRAARCDLGHYVQIDGSVISTHDLYIGEHCRIFGPVIAENRLVIRKGTVIGSPENPCTVSAPNIVIESGCVIYGTLWAGKQGLVVVAQHEQKGVAA